jgi:hypothetical protein
MLSQLLIVGLRSWSRCCAGLGENERARWNKMVKYQVITLAVCIAVFLVIIVVPIPFTTPGGDANTGGS